MSKDSVSSVNKIQPSMPKEKIKKVLNREQMISDAANSLEKQRRFVSGDRMNDWLAEEPEIEAALNRHYKREAIGIYTF